MSWLEALKRRLNVFLPYSKLCVQEILTKRISCKYKNFMLLCSLMSGLSSMHPLRFVTALSLQRYRSGTQRETGDEGMFETYTRIRYREASEEVWRYLKLMRSLCYRLCIFFVEKFPDFPFILLQLRLLIPR